MVFSPRITQCGKKVGGTNAPSHLQKPIFSKSGSALNYKVMRANKITAKLFAPSDFFFLAHRHTAAELNVGIVRSCKPWIVESILCFISTFLHHVFENISYVMFAFDAVFHTWKSIGNIFRGLYRFS